MVSKHGGAASGGSAERIDTAIARAKELGLAEHLLGLAHADKGWRARFERFLVGTSAPREYREGGTRPGDVWHEGLLRGRVLRGLYASPVVLVALARANADVALLIDGGGDVVVFGEDHGPFLALLAEYAASVDTDDPPFESLERACEALASLRSEDPDSTPAGVMDRGGASGGCVATVVDSSELLERLRELERECIDRAREIRELAKANAARAREVARKDRAFAARKFECEVAKARVELLERDLQAERAARAEVGRRADKLEAGLHAAQRGKKTIEAKLHAEERRFTDLITELREKYEAARLRASTLESQVDLLGGRVDDEQARRHELEEILSAFGFDRLKESSQSLHAVVDTLVLLRDGVSGYLERQAEQERARRDQLEEADRSARAAAQAKREEDEVEAAWAGRGEERMTSLERELFSDGSVDHVLIDGHNLVHRVFRPDQEAKTRPWLERVVEHMAHRLELRGWDMRIHLVFDSQHESNHHPQGHGVTVYFHNNTREGGADAKIAQLLREGNPQSHYVIVSTDIKHVWRDAEAHMRTEDTCVDLVRAERLAEYLEVLAAASGAASHISASAVA